MKKAFLLDVQKTEDDQMLGNIHDLCLDEKYSFIGMDKAFLLMDQALNQAEHLEKIYDICGQVPNAVQEVVRFYIRVLFCEQNSWQGEVTWTKTGEKRYFRSALELLKMVSDWCVAS